MVRFLCVTKTGGSSLLPHACWQLAERKNTVQLCSFVLAKLLAKLWLPKVSVQCGATRGYGMEIMDLVDKNDMPPENCTTHKWTLPAYSLQGECRHWGSTLRTNYVTQLFWIRKIRHSFARISRNYPAWKPGILVYPPPNPDPLINTGRQTELLFRTRTWANLSAELE